MIDVVQCDEMHAVRRTRYDNSGGASKNSQCFLGCIVTPSSVARNSPTSSLISVLFPAPFGPTTAIRDAIEHCALAFTSVNLSREGYLNDAPVSFRIAFVLDLMPSSGPGRGKWKTCTLSANEKYCWRLDTCS